MEARNPDFVAYTQQKIVQNKFIKWLGFSVTKIEAGYVEGELEFREMHEQQDGWLHGGITATLLDMVQGFAAYSLVEDGQKVFTVEAKTSYLNPGTSNKFFARGGVIKPGRRFHFCEAEVYYLKGTEEVIVAKGSSTMAVI